MHGEISWWPERDRGIKTGITYSEDMEDGETFIQACTRMRKAYLPELKKQVKAQFIGLGLTPPF
jgi:hypothetical protein